jgi:hypothetical protein
MPKGIYVRKPKTKIVVEGAIKDEKITEQNTKETSSVLYLLPRNILKELNEHIDKGDVDIPKLEIFLKERYHGKLNVATRYQINKYIGQYKKEKEANSNSIKNIISGNNKIGLNNLDTGIIDDIQNNSTFDVNDKKKILEDLMIECKNRINYIKQLPKFYAGPGMESNLSNYVGEIREIIKVLLELSGEIDASKGSDVVVNLINSNIYEIFSVVAKTVSEIYGLDKIILFREKLKENLLSQKSDLNLTDIIKEEPKKIEEAKEIVEIKVVEEKKGEENEPTGN